MKMYTADKEKETEINLEDFGVGLEQEHCGATILLYAEGEFGAKGELIQRLVAKHLTNIQIDYANKVFHAEYSGEEIYGIKKGEIFDIAFYQMVVV